MTGTGKGAQHGILIRNAEALETLETIDTLVVDKTGTLTMGKPDLVAVTPHGGVAEEELLTLAAAVERGSEHPLGAAIVAGAEARGVRHEEAGGLSRSEEHTSELQSLMRISYAVFCLKKKKQTPDKTR